MRDPARDALRRLLAWTVPPLILVGIVLGTPFVLELWGWSGPYGAGGDPRVQSGPWMGPFLPSDDEEPEFPDSDAGDAPPDVIVVDGPGSPGDPQEDAPEASDEESPPPDPDTASAHPPIKILWDPPSQESKPDAHDEARGSGQGNEPPSRSGHAGGGPPPWAPAHGRE